MGKKTEDTREQDLEIEYRVKVRTHGKPSLHIDQIGETLAKLCALNFTSSEVMRGKTVYEWNGLKSSWGPLAKDSGFVDNADYHGVTSNP